MQMLRQRVITVTYTQKRTSMDTREDWKNLILPSEREKDGVFLFSHKCQVLSFFPAVRQKWQLGASESGRYLSPNEFTCNTDRNLAGIGRWVG